jgi:hypothetical protein
MSELEFREIMAQKMMRQLKLLHLEDEKRGQVEETSFAPEFFFLPLCKIFLDLQN